VDVVGSVAGSGARQLVVEGQRHVPVRPETVSNVWVRLCVDEFTAKKS
jgi:hypothetical protein